MSAEQQRQRKPATQPEAAQSPSGHDQYQQESSDNISVPAPIATSPPLDHSTSNTMRRLLIDQVQRTLGNASAGQYIRRLHQESGQQSQSGQSVMRTPTTRIQRDDTKPTITSSQRPPTASSAASMPKQDFLNLCGQVNTVIDAADRGATAWLSSLAIAYGDAWKNHTDRLKGQAEDEKLEQELILGAALAFIPGGIGGEVGAALKRAGSSDFIIDGVKDLTKYAGRSPAMAGLKGAGAIGGGGTGLQAFPTDPLQWQNQVTIRIKSELLTATKNLEIWQNKANTNDPDFPMDFNPVVVMNGALVINGKKAADLQPVDQGKTAEDFERGFWKTWLEKFGYKLISSAGRVGVFYGSEQNYGKKIRKRCEALGLNVEQYASVSRDAVDAEARKRNQQARNP